MIAFDFIKLAVWYLWILLKWSWPILLLAFLGLYLNYRRSG